MNHKGLLFALFAIVVTMFSTSLLPSESNAEESRTVMVLTPRAVNVMSRDAARQGLADGQGMHSGLRRCTMEHGGKVTVKSGHGHRLLVAKYTAPKRELQRPCSTGDVFFMEPREFDDMLAKQECVAGDTK